MPGPEYAVDRPGAETRYFSSWNDCRRALKDELGWLRNMALSGQVPMANVRRILAEIDAIPREGGELDLPVEEYLGMRYRVKVRRKGVPG